MSDPQHPYIKDAEALLQSLMPDQFLVDYCPDFPRRDGSPARWFQVVFSVGPGEAGALRTQVHELFPRILAALADIPIVSSADLVSLRARRHCPESPVYRPDHPFMFIEADWTGTAYRGMCKRRDFSNWSIESMTYQNHFDAHDALTRQYAGQAVR